MTPTDNDVFLPAGRVRQRYGVSDMSLYRWLRDAELNFPKPIYIGRYRYWRLADLLAFEQSCHNKERPMLPERKEAHGLPPTGLQMEQQIKTPVYRDLASEARGSALKAGPYVEFPNADPQPFDWHEDADSVVVDHSPGIAVYTNCS